MGWKNVQIRYNICKRLNEGLYMKLKIVLSLLGIVVFLAACLQTEDDNQDIDLDESTFEAQILEVHEKYLMVTPNDGEAELRSADRISVSTKEASLVDNEGNKISINDFEEGMQIEILYDGMIAESYPAQIINCYEIRMVK